MATSPSGPTLRSVRDFRLADRVAAWLVVTLGAVIGTVAMGDALRDAKFLFFWVAVLFAAWAVGFWAGMVTGLVGVFTVDRFLVAPPGSLGPLSPGEIGTLAIWVPVCALLSWFVAHLADQQKHQALFAQTLQAQSQSLVAQVLDARRLEESGRQAMERSLRLQTITSAFSRALTPEEVAVVVVERAFPLVGAAVAGMRLLSDDGAELVLAHAKGYAPNAMSHVRIPVDDRSGSGVVVRTREPLYFPDRASYAARFPQNVRAIADIGAEATAFLPLVFENRALGSLSLSFYDARVFSEAERELYSSIAAHCAQALERARLYEAEHAARVEGDRARAEAERANAAKAEFLAMISHELRTPLNGIGGYVQLLQMQLYGPVTEAQSNALSRIGRAQQHLVRLITNVLNYAKAERGSLTYELKPALLDDIVTEASALVATQFAAKQVRATYDAAPALRPIWVLADRDKVVEILTNLLSNAAKYTAEGGSVTVSTVAPDDDASAALIHVRDTGAGIAEGKLEAIFDPFVRLELPGRTGVEGTGLGLSISREFARAMGGDVTVESASGVGSTFTVRLKRTEAPAKGSESGAASSGRREGAIRRRRHRKRSSGPTA
ncbi:MAG TPA: ATP-binding protein [Gemmatimonadaceae bacterium]|nr:ATP-binding protein [Gemmatimonadaceae bacterium]